MDNFNKVCGIILAMLVLLSVCFAIKANAEEYVPAESADNSAQADQSADGEVHEVTQVTGVQVNDPTLYEKLDKLQDSVDALAAALAPSVDAESGAEEKSCARLHGAVVGHFRAAGAAQQHCYCRDCRA